MIISNIVQISYPFSGSGMHSMPGSESCSSLLTAPPIPMPRSILSMPFRNAVKYC